LLHEGIAFIEPYVREYGLFALLVIIYLESLGAPLPGESALIAASALAVRGDFSVVELFIGVWIAAVAGDTTGYAIGRLGGSALLRRYGHLVKLTPERLNSLEELFRRRGAWIVASARFVVVLRQLNGLIAGSVRMPLHSFLAANAIGGAAWTACWTLGPYYLGSLFGLG
jgi:membrane protein DedA with SNARE-associated domain